MQRSIDASAPLYATRLVPFSITFLLDLDSSCQVGVLAGRRLVPVDTYLTAN